MKKVIIIGATSGIGKSLTKLYLRRGYDVGLVGRRIGLLEEFQKQYPNNTFIKKIDIRKTKQAMKSLEQLIKSMKGMDIIILNSGVLIENPNLEWDSDKITVETNVLGILAMANVAYQYFVKKRKGHIVGISSVASLRSSWRSTSYTASKAFISNYLKGLRAKINKNRLKIYVTEVLPGFVSTPMIQGKKDKFWVSSSGKAARQIYKAIQRKRKLVYVSKRWRLIAWMLRILPKDWTSG